MTEFRFSYTLSRAGETVATGTLVTINPYFPARVFESLCERYHADYIRVYDSLGQIWEKEIEQK